MRNNAFRLLFVQNGLSSRTMFRIRLVCFALAAVCLAGFETRGAQLIQPPPAGKLYQGVYFDEPAAEHDPTEHDVTPENVAKFEQILGTKTAWIYFSDNWFESKKFPAPACEWIRALGKI